MAKSKAYAEPAMDDDWQCQSDADALARAAEVVADPKRLAKAKAHIETKAAGLDKLLTGLRRRS